MSWPMQYYMRNWRTLKKKRWWWRFGHTFVHRYVCVHVSSMLLPTFFTFFPFLHTILIWWHLNNLSILFTAIIYHRTNREWNFGCMIVCVSILTLKCLSNFNLASLLGRCAQPTYSMYVAVALLASPEWSKAATTLTNLWWKKKNIKAMAY